MIRSRSNITASLLRFTDGRRSGPLALPGLRCRVGAPVAGGPSHRTGLVLFTSGSSGRQVVTPIAGRFTDPLVPRDADDLDLSRVRHMAARVGTSCCVVVGSWFGNLSYVDSTSPGSRRQVACCGHRAPLTGHSVLCDKLLSPSASTFAADAFPPRAKLLHGWDDLSIAFRYCASVLDLLGHRLSSFRSTAYRLRGTPQTSMGKTNRLHDHPVANTSAFPTNIGLHRRGPAHPMQMPYGASLSLETVVHL